MTDVPAAFHQSSTDKLMPFRMLRYLVRIWDRYLAQHPGADRLPVVVPLVLYHDERPWSGPVEIRDMIDLDAGWADAVDEYVPRFRFLLHDLCLVDEKALRAMPLTRWCG